jgi:hypothetical protein
MKLQLSEAGRPEGVAAAEFSRQEAMTDFPDGRATFPISLAGKEAGAELSGEGPNLLELALRQPLSPLLLSETARLILRHF